MAWQCVLKRARTLLQPGKGTHCTGDKSMETRCMTENFQYIGSTLNEMFTSDVEIKKILAIATGHLAKLNKS